MYRSTAIIMNAKQEFINAVGYKYLKCAFIQYAPSFYDEVERSFSLPINYTAEQYSRFLESLDFEYDNGYGSQELFGNIWFDDGTWSDRYEYDGSEMWDYHNCPAIPNHLQ